MNPRGHRFRFLFALVALGPAAQVAVAQPPGVQPVFRAQMALANPEVQQGRIVCRLNRLTRWGNNISRKSGASESLRFEQSERGTAMHYKLSSAERRLAIDALEHELTILHEHLTNGEADEVVRFEQRPGQTLSFEVRTGDVTQQLHGDTVWHLWLHDPEICQRHLAPLCELLGMSLPWTKFTQALESKLFLLADAGQAHDATLWRVWLSELKDDRFAVREAADRQLRSAGTALAPFLRRLDTKQLDAEQRYRLRRIMAEFELDEGADTVDSTAEWLADDPRVWLVFLVRPDAEKRRTAASQLERLLDSPITFDADAAEDVRASQLVELQARVARAFDRN
ncbi:MAG: hypothetical protein SGJ19_10005 [Planctomycetia bacterium]|nr:hypothetical protein [Planctomycetia bacterium]